MDGALKPQSSPRIKLVLVHMDKEELTVVIELPAYLKITLWYIVIFYIKLNVPEFKRMRSVFIICMCFIMCMSCVGELCFVMLGQFSFFLASNKHYKCCH